MATATVKKRKPQVMWVLRKVSTGKVNLHTLAFSKARAMEGFTYHCELGNLEPIMVCIVPKDEYATYRL